MGPVCQCFPIHLFEIKDAYYKVTAWRIEFLGYFRCDSPLFSPHCRLVQSRRIAILRCYQTALAEGKITEKERLLWEYVLSAYGAEEFTTKQLEKDFRNAAYATIRTFVMKFHEMGLLTARKAGNRVFYRVGGTSDGRPL